MIKPIDIVLDFDGTCVAQVYPGVGGEIGAVPVLRELTEAGHRLILFTMRCNRDDGLLDATNWFRKWDIPLYGIQSHPNQKEWTDSPKAYGELIIDDRSLGIPTTFRKSLSDVPYVDWYQTRLLLKKRGLLK